MAGKRQKKKRAKRYGSSPSWGVNVKTPASEPIDIIPEQTQSSEKGSTSRKSQRKKRGKQYSLSPEWGGTAKAPIPDSIDATPEQTHPSENRRTSRYNYEYWDSMQTGYSGDDTFTIGEANFWGLYERLMILRESDAPFIIEKTNRLIELLENEYARNEDGLYNRLSRLTPEDVTSIDDWVVDSDQKTGGLSDSRFVSFYNIITGTSATVMTAKEFGD